MVDTEKIIVDGMELCNTFSTTGYKLLQVETNTVYGSSCIDLIEGYYADGKPYSRFTYVETDEVEVDEDEQGVEVE